MGENRTITGGISGIGKASAVALAAMGANVVIVGRNPERGEAALEDIRSAEPQRVRGADAC